MTDIASATADTSALATFDGRDVIRSQVKVAGAGKAITELLSIEPTEFHHGDLVHVVIECEVSAVGFPPVVKGIDLLARLHTLTTIRAAIIDDHMALPVLDTAADRLARAREQAQGIVRIPYSDDDDADLLGGA